ncbi:MAG: hypothetical protein QOI73_2437 [Solirubrobacteraceae bacterium]|jgi:hypothetical protein|nr:hypothetical protein [Solirubrobacteraceae bacterium]
MRRHSLKIAILATLATFVSTVSTASAVVGDPSQWG